MSRIIRTNKKESSLTWRETNNYLDVVKRFKERSSRQQTFSEVIIEGEDPVAVVCLSDLHIGAGGFDHNGLLQVTNEILSTPDLYIGLLGDIAEMAIRLRGVAEIAHQGLTPGEQTQYVKTWLAEIAPRVLWATWGNHDIERQEQLTGYSDLADLFASNVIYHAGIGHLNLTVGQQVYKIAVTHRFKGHSAYNPAQGAVRYLMHEAPDREIALCGDSHKPGICQFPHGEQRKLAITSGTMHTESGYAKRYFSLYAHTNFPVIMLRGDDHHEATAFWSLGEYTRVRNAM